MLLKFSLCFTLFSNFSHVCKVEFMLNWHKVLFEYRNVQKNESISLIKFTFIGVPVIGVS